MLHRTFHDGYYFDVGEKGAEISTRVLDVLVKRKLASLYTHIQTYDLPLKRLTVGWFPTLFKVCNVDAFFIQENVFSMFVPRTFIFLLSQDLVPPKVRLRIMDLYMMEGRLALFATSLTLLLIVESEMTQYLFPDAMEEIMKKKLKNLDESLFLDKIWRFLASPSDSLKWRDVW
jgi:hypothetical protein